MFLVELPTRKPAMIHLPLTDAEAAFLAGQLRYDARLVAGSQTARDALTLARRIEELYERVPADEPTRDGELRPLS